MPPPRGKAVRRASSQDVPRSGLRSAPGSSSPPDSGREVPHPQPRGPRRAGKQSRRLLTAREGGPHQPRSSAPAAAPTRVLTELDTAAGAGSREQREKGWEGRGGTRRGTREPGPPGPEALTSAFPSRAGRGAWMGSRREPRGPEEEPLLQRGRAAGRHPRPGLRPGCREREGRERRFEWRGRGGCAPPPKTERVGCWSPAEGSARRRRRQRESRAESVRGRVGDRGEGGGGRGQQGREVGPQTGRPSPPHHPTKSCLGLEQSTTGSETLCHFLIHT